MGITSTNGTHRQISSQPSPCHLEWCWHCLSPGCKTWVYELKLLSWRMACMNRRGNQEPKKNKLPFGCLLLPNQKDRIIPNTQMLMEETLSMFIYRIHHLYTLHKQSSRTHAPKIYRAWSDTLSWNQLQSLPHKKSCDARNVDSLPRGRNFRVGRKRRSDTYIT